MHHFKVGNSENVYENKNFKSEEVIQYWDDMTGLLKFRNLSTVFKLGNYLRIT